MLGTVLTSDDLDGVLMLKVWGHVKVHFLESQLGVLVYLPPQNMQSILHWKWLPNILLFFPISQTFFMVCTGMKINSTANSQNKYYILRKALHRPQTSVYSSHYPLSQISIFS